MKQAAFYVTINYPDKEGFYEILDCLEEMQADYVELGIPVEDPFLDGELVTQSHQKVLADGFNESDLLEALTRISKIYTFKKILMTYQAGLDQYQIPNELMKQLDGVLCVDETLSPSEYENQVQIYHTDLSIRMIKEKAKRNQVFSYLMSGNGKTGTFTKLPTEFTDMIPVIRQHCNLPVLVGFGVQTPNDVKQVVESGADGVIIGSEFLKTYQKAGIIGIRQYIKEMKQALL